MNMDTNHGHGHEMACDTCQRRSYKAGGLLRCMEWRRHPSVVRCSHYVGPIAEMHVKIYYGPEYADTLAHAKT